MVYNVLKYNIVDEEIEAAITYYEAISFELGKKFENAIEYTLDLLEKNPKNYFNLPDNKHRRIPIPDFPYALIYSVDGNIVIVKILFPLREDPAKLWTRLTIL